jgi:hypothetical protein
MNSPSELLGLQTATGLGFFRVTYLPQGGFLPIATWYPSSMKNDRTTHENIFGYGSHGGWAKEGAKDRSHVNLRIQDALLVD